MKPFDPLKNIFYSAKNAYHTGKGSNCLRKKDIKQGLYHLKEGLVCSEKTGNMANVAFSHEILADAYLCAKDYPLAIRHAEQSCSIYEKFIDKNASDLFYKRLQKIREKLRKIKFQSSLQS